MPRETQEDGTARSTHDVPVLAGGLPKAHYGHLFSVPILTHSWSDSSALNVQLRARILEYAGQDRGVANTNVGGWHSASGQLEFLGDLRDELFTRMGAMVNEGTHRLVQDRRAMPLTPTWSVSAWANVARSGDFQTTHTHPGATWSGVYYVDSGDEEGSRASGKLLFLDPAPAAPASFFPRLSRTTPEVLPVAGLMILFPSYVPHTVSPHKGSRPRISISFNFRSEPYP
jgi:uncharacterized protein (TIGR02466 family)